MDINKDVAAIFPRRIKEWPKAHDIVKEEGRIVHIDAKGKLHFISNAGMKLLKDMTAMMTRRYSTKHQAIWSMGNFEPGLPVIARWPVDKNFYRAEVIRQSTRNNRCYYVRFVDFGNTAYVNVADLRNRVMAYGTPVQAHKFELAGVAPKLADCWSSDELDFLFDAVKDKTCVVEVVKEWKPRNEFKGVKVRVKEEILDLADFAVQQGKLLPSTHR